MAESGATANAAQNARLAALPPAVRKALEAAQAKANEKLKASQEEAMEKARLAAEALQQQQKKATRCVAELEINDYPQMARQKVISRDSLMAIQEMAQVVIITKGQYYAPGRNPPAGERKLYLLIEGETEDVVKAARKELRRQLGEYAETAAPQQDSKYGKYSV